MAGAFILAADYINAQRERSRLVAELAEAMKTVDAVIFPTARCPARPIGEDFMASGFQPFFNRAFNVTGSPALSICNGFSATGLPLALQIGGRRSKMRSCCASATRWNARWERGHAARSLLRPEFEMKARPRFFRLEKCRWFHSPSVANRSRRATGSRQREYRGPGKNSEPQMDADERSWVEQYIRLRTCL